VILFRASPGDEASNLGGLEQRPVSDLDAREFAMTDEAIYAALRDPEQAGDLLDGEERLDAVLKLAGGVRSGHGLPT
jgi:hypothetical protein